MTFGGWVFLIASSAFVWGLAGWCYYKVFTVKDEHVVKPPDMLGG
jgi:hypothetical protein